jgi:hypothetical protein
MASPVYILVLNTVMIIVTVTNTVLSQECAEVDMIQFSDRYHLLVYKANLDQKETL